MTYIKLMDVLGVILVFIVTTLWFVNIVGGDENTFHFETK